MGKTNLTTLIVILVFLPVLTLLTDAKAGCWFPVVPIYSVEEYDDVHLFMRWDTIVELRFESPEADYAFCDKIRVGSSLDEVLEVVGQPAETAEGEQIGWVNNVLYKDIEGTKGRCYYHRPDHNVRFFFSNYKVKAMYITRSDYNGG